MCPWVVGVFGKYKMRRSFEGGNILEDFFLYLNKIKIDYNARVFSDITLRSTGIQLLQGKERYIDADTLSFFNPQKIILLNDLKKGYIMQKTFFPNTLNNEVLIIDGFFCCSHYEKKIIRNLILSLSKQYKQIVMYGNYFNLEERISVAEQSNICFNAVFL